MKIAVLSPIAWRTPPRHYGPWENVVSLLTEGLVARGIDVTLFATADSRTSGRLVGVCPRGYEEDGSIPPKVWECLHISEVFERAAEFDLIHNHFDFLPLTYSGLTGTPVVTTIHGFSSPNILPVYRKYNGRTFYVAISDADRNPELDYIATIHHGIDIRRFTFRADHGDYLLFFGRIHHDKGAKESIEIARRTGRKLILAGIIQDQTYFENYILPHLDGDRITYIGSVGPGRRDELLGRAYALLHPINFDEPFGLSVVEAMACGTPVIAINRGSMPEIVINGATGFLTESADEMAEAVTKVRQIDRAECRSWVETRFSVERMVEDYIEAYETIIRKTARENSRPWGFYEVLSDRPDHKIKRITVSAGHRLSYQRHSRRSEHWYVVKGRAVVVRNGKETEVVADQTVDIPAATWHRIANTGSEELIFIEVQRGDYFGEDDIERSADDYGRA